MPEALRILSIEDDPKDTQLIQELLETEGVVCAVKRVDTEAALLASLEQGGIDLILADYSLPSFDGISALKLAMIACPEVPFIFVSGTLGEEVAIEALKIGATDYVLKTSLSRLAPSVRRALREATEKAERKRAEEALRQSETYLAEAQRLSRTGSFGWGVSSGQIYWSEETYKIFDYDPATKPTLELVFRRIHPDDRDRMQQTIDRAIEARVDLDFEHRLLMPDASVKHVHVLARALETSSGHLEYVGAVMDVTAAKRTEETLRESEGYLAEAQRFSHTGSWAYDPATTKTTYMSEECFRVLGLDPQGAMVSLEATLQRIHPDDRGTIAEKVERATRERAEFELDYRYCPPAGELRDIHQAGHPVLSPSGGLVEFVGTLMDVTERKRAEKKLRRSEESLLEAQKLSHTGSWRHDIASGTVTVSPEVYRMHDIKPDENASNREFFFGRFHPEDRKRVVDLFERAEAEKTEFEVGYRIVLPDGTIKHLHTIGRPVLNESSELVEFVGTVIDVTERKRGEEATRLLAAIVESSHDAIVSKDLNGIITSWNKGAEQLFGYAPEEAVGQNITLIIPPDRHDEERAIIERLRLGERVDHFETVRARKDGSLLDVALTISPMKDAAGRIVGASKLARDITERKRAEESLRRSESYLAEAQRLSHTGSWAWAPATGEIRYCSEECYRLMGFDPLGGQPRFEAFFKRIHPDDQPRIAKTIERATRERAEFELDDRIVFPGGEIRDVHVVGHPVLSPSGDLVEFVGTMMDVTERKRAEEERERLRQAQAELAHINRVTTMGELTASLAHEVNQPIAAAVTSANSCYHWLAGDVPNLDKARAAAMRIVKDGTRAAEIISRIRLLFQKGAPQWESIDVNEVIVEIIVLLRGEATRYSISVGAELAADLPQVMGDRVQLQQVMMNLMMNSIEAMKSVDGARELVIGSHRTESEQLQVSVSDSGVGLPPQQLEQIFDAFFTTKAQGTGMGLRICRSIVESHGGRLWAGNNSPRGASLYLTLPAKVEAHE